MRLALSEFLKMESELVHISKICLACSFNRLSWEIMWIYQ